MYKVFEIDYHDMAHLVGKAETLPDARRIARQALKESKHEFPCFISDGKKCVEDIR